jgi:hypothetical protein
MVGWPVPCGAVVGRGPSRKDRQDGGPEGDLATMPAHVRSCIRRRVISRQLRAQTPRFARIEIQSALLDRTDPVKRAHAAIWIRKERACGSAAVRRWVVLMPRAPLFDRP